MPVRPTHFEFYSADPEATVEFLAKVFGWRAEQWGDQEYWLLDTGEGPGINGAVTRAGDDGPKTVNTCDVEDLDAATVDDVKGFFKTYYAPNNAVLALVGDLDTKATLEKVKKYFGDIPRQEAPKPVDLSEPKMTAERRDKMEDKLARLTLLTIAYKTPPATHADSYALSALGNILGGGESSRLYQKLVKEKEICSSANSFSASRMVSVSQSFERSTWAT